MDIYHTIFLKTQLHSIRFSFKGVTGTGTLLSKEAFSEMISIQCFYCNKRNSKIIFFTNILRIAQSKTNCASQLIPLRHEPWVENI